MNERVTLDQFIKSFSQAHSRLKNNVRATLYAQGNSILDDLRKRSPIDDDVFRPNWRFRRVTSTRDIAVMSIMNMTPYAGWLDEGAEPGGIPWHWPNDTNPGPVSRSGKLILRNGRVWAGGKSPSGFVIGGISDVVIMNNWKRQHDLTKALAESAIGAI